MSSRIQRSSLFDRPAALLALALSAFAFAPQAFAQDDDADNSNATEEGAVSLEAVTVYGTSNPIPVFDYPGQVSVITRDDVDTYAPSAISDMLRDVPGLDFAGGPRRTGETPSIRGLGGENVLVLLDGARQSFISAHDGRFFVDPGLIQTAEVVRGPASALYGSGAVGGILAFETVTAGNLLRADESTGFRFRGGYQGVNDEYLGSASAYTRTDNFDLIASFGVRNSGDIELASGADLPSDDDIETGLLKATWNVTDAFALDASWTGFRNEAVEPNNGQGLNQSNPPLTNDVIKDIETDTFRIGAEINPVANDWINTRITAYQTTTSVDELDESTTRRTLRDIETTGLSIRNASQFTIGSAETILTLGGDWYEDEQVGTDNTSMDGTRDGVPDGQSEFFGVYAQLEMMIDQPFGLPGDLLVIPGIRYDEFDSSAPGEADNSDDATSPRIAASYGPVEWFRVFGNYSEGFRAPSVNELYLDGVHFPLPHPVLFDPTSIPPSFVFVNNNFVPNPDLVPEKAETFEFGAGVDFVDVFTNGDRFQAKASYYDSDVEDLINIAVFVTFEPTCFAPPFFPCTAGTTESSNIANAELSGFEFEAIYDSPRFLVRSTYASIDGEDSATGEDIGALTPDRFSLDGRVKVPEWNAAFGARFQYADDFDRQRLEGGEFVTFDERDSYTVVDIYATWQPSFFRGIRIDAGIDNVFDEDYERVFAGVSEPGINPRIAVTYQVGF
ncbi:MAG: TonB-dependent hemoglobin/transferrin/lactoferrin family receptor [Pseudomonadota bacterium]